MSKKNISSASIIVIFLLLLLFFSSKNIAHINSSADKPFQETPDIAVQNTDVTFSSDIAVQSEDVTTSSDIEIPKEEETLEEISEVVEETPSLPVFTSEEINDDLLNRILGLSYPTYQQNDISLEDLRYLQISYVGFDEQVHMGELICNKLIAEDLLEIFEELYKNNYPIEKIQLIDDYDANDDLSCEANNTSCFCYRNVDNTSSLSNHALGLAIDVNPLYNPYVKPNKDGSIHVGPPQGAAYVDRTVDCPYIIDENDLCYRLFREHGFTWGGAWKSCKDYQHFEKEF